MGLLSTCYDDNVEMLREFLAHDRIRSYSAAENLALTWPDTEARKGKDGTRNQFSPVEIRKL